MMEVPNRWYSKTTWNGVEIDLPYNHDLSQYGALGKRSEYDPLWDPATALQSLRFHHLDKNGIPVFFVQFKVPFNSISELAYGLFVFTSEVPPVPESIDLADDESYVTLEGYVYSICNIEANVLSKSDYPHTCWFGRAEAIGDDLSSISELIREEHYCSETRYSRLIAVQKGDLSPIENDGGQERWFEGELELEDDGINEGYVADYVLRIETSDESEWRVIVMERFH